MASKRRRQVRRRLTVLVAAAVLALLGFFFIRASTGPESYTIQGVDVSRHQGDIDWRAVAKAGIAFAWIKATEGGDHLDIKFRRNWDLAGAAGVRRGAYHFVYWCRPAKDQAAWFVANVPADPDALPPVLDVEWNPGSKSCPKKLARDAALAEMQVMLDAMEKAYRKRPVIYAPLDFYLDVMHGELGRYPIWVRNLGPLPATGYGDRDWLIWQHSETGSVPGISGTVDRDTFNGSAADWRVWVESQG